MARFRQFSPRAEHHRTAVVAAFSLAFAGIRQKAEVVARVPARSCSRSPTGRAAPAVHLRRRHAPGMGAAAPGVALPAVLALVLGLVLALVFALVPWTAAHADAAHDMPQVPTVPWASGGARR